MEQLKLYYAAIDKNYDDRTNTKKWCITAWLATIAFVGKEGQSLTFLAATGLIWAPIVMFWLLEATQGAYAKVLIDKGLEMEQMLLNGWEGVETPGQYLYLSGRHAPMRVKAKATLYAAFAMESVVTLYVLLAGVSPVLLHLMRG